MGNSNNSDNGKHGNIFIQIEKPFYYPNDVVSGTVFMDIT